MKGFGVCGALQRDWCAFMFGVLQKNYQYLFL